MHQFLLYNGRITETSSKLVSPGQTGYMNGWGVFSTIRVFDGVLFAWERHWSRMTRDARLLRVPMPADPEEIRQALRALVEANQAWNGVLRVCIVRNHGGIFEGADIERDYDLVAFTADVNQWGRGVHLDVEPNARHAACRFAGTKVLSWSHNLAWLEAAKAAGKDEVILLNEHGMVSECTSANIFMAAGDQVWTPPLSSGCLPGVTREILLREVQMPGVTVLERDFSLEDLRAADSVFITSTTRELLHVLSIAREPTKNRGQMRERLQEAFSRYVDQYVQNRTKPSALAST